jgi:hypothetical protein
LQNPQNSGIFICKLRERSEKGSSPLERFFREAGYVFHAESPAITVKG